MSIQYHVSIKVCITFTIDVRIVHCITFVKFTSFNINQILHCPMVQRYKVFVVSVVYFPLVGTTQTYRCKHVSCVCCNCACGTKTRRFLEEALSLHASKNKGSIAIRRMGFFTGMESATRCSLPPNQTCDTIFGVGTRPSNLQGHAISVPDVGLNNTTLGNVRNVYQLHIQLFSEMMLHHTQCVNTLSCSMCYYLLAGFSRPAFLHGIAMWTTA
jgi:hypothetical protein